MSAPHSGMERALLRSESVHANNVHAKIAVIHLDARQPVTRERTRVRNVDETRESRDARAEKLAQHSAQDNVPLDFLLAQLEEQQQRLQDATEEHNTQGIHHATAEIARLNARIRNMREGTLTNARDAHLAAEAAALKEIEDYDNAGDAFRETVEHYVKLHKDVAGHATIATQAISRTLRNRLTALLPATAKYEIARNLKHLSKEKYTELLQRRAAEIDALENGAGLDDTDRRLLERDLIRETLHHLDRWGFVNDVAPSVVEYKKRQRVAKANVTRLENRKKKIEEQLAVSWTAPLDAIAKLLPWRRWALHRELDNIKAQAARERGRLTAITSFTTAVRAPSEVRMNIPYFEENGERATEQLYHADVEPLEKKPQKHAA